MRVRTARRRSCIPIVFSTLLACAAPAPAPTPKLESPPAAAPAPGAPPIDEQTAPEGQLPKDVRPTRYAIALDVDPALERFSGEETIELALSAPRAVLWMHGRGLQVSSASIESSGESIAATWTEVGDTGVARLVPARPLHPGAAALHLAWSAPFDPQLTGVYRSRAAGHDYVFSKFEATYARRAFPSFDEPDLKTPFAISMTVPERDLAISNGPASAEAAAGAGKKRVTFAETPPLPTYLVLFVAGEFDVASAVVAPNRVRAAPLPLRALAPLGNADKLATALREGQGSIEELEQQYGIPFPYPKIDLIAVPDFQSGAMENAGGITFKDQLLLIDEKTASQDQRRTVSSVIAHELAHQWFGDLVTMSWWDDLWLNEGFATFMATRVLEARHPEYQADLEQVESTGGVMQQDELISARKIRQPILSTHDITNAFDGITYEKGAAVLHMLERYLGAGKFLTGVSADLRAHANGNATTGDLLAALSAASGADVRSPFESFLDRSGVPLIEASVRCGADGASLHVKQSRSLPLGSTGSRDETWQVPVCARYQAAGKQQEACKLIAPHEEDVPLSGCPDWLLPNADAAGYYRWSLAPDDLVKLREKGLPKLTARERISFAQNLVSAFRSGALPADAVLGALLPLAADPSGKVAEQPMGILAFLHNQLALPEASGPRGSKALQAAIEQRAIALYRPLLEGKGGLGWKAAPGESTERRGLREAVLEFLLRSMNDPVVLHKAAALGEAYLGRERIDPGAVDSDLVSIALVAASMEGGAKTQARLEERLFATEDSQLRGRLLFAIASTRDPALSKAALELSFDPRLRQSERALPFFVQLGDPVTRAQAFSILQEKFDALAKVLPDRYAGYLVGAVGFCDADNRQRVSDFFAPRAPTINGAPRNLAGALEEMQLCIARVDAQGASARAFFAGKRR